MLEGCKEYIDKKLEKGRLTFSLRDHNVSNESVVYLAQQLTNNENVRFLIITVEPIANYEVRLNKECLTALANLLKINKHIIGLSITGIDFDYRDTMNYSGLDEDYSGVVARREHELESLKCLVKSAQHLKYLKLHYTTHHGPINEPFVNIPHFRISSLLLEGVENNKSLLFLDVDRNKIGSYQLKKIDKYLQRNIGNVLDGININALSKKFYNPEKVLGDDTKVLREINDHIRVRNIISVRDSLAKAHDKLREADRIFKFFKGSNITISPFLMKLKTECNTELNDLNKLYDKNFHTIHHLFHDFQYRYDLTKEHDPEILKPLLLKNANWPLEILLNIFEFVSPRDVNHKKNLQNGDIKSLEADKGRQ